MHEVLDITGAIALAASISSFLASVVTGNPSIIKSISVNLH